MVKKTVSKELFKKYHEEHTVLQNIIFDTITNYEQAVKVVNDMFLHINGFNLSDIEMEDIYTWEDLKSELSMLRDEMEKMMDEVVGE